MEEIHKVYYVLDENKKEITVKDAEKILADQRAKVAKDADKVRKDAMKRHLKMQTKPVRKSIKRNAKAQKKRDKNIQYRKTAPLFNQ